MVSGLVVSLRLSVIAGWAILASVACASNVDQEEYTAANSALMDVLPTYPGSTSESRSHSSYAEGERSGVKGYTTKVVVHVGAEVTDDDVVQFYIEALGDDWQHCEYEINFGAPENPATPSAGGSVTSVNFIRADGARVGVLTDGLSPVTRSNTYEVGLDHDSADDPCTHEEWK